MTFLCGPHLPTPDYGVFATTCREFKWKGRQTSVVHFWPADVADGHLDVGQACFYQHADVIRKIAVGASSTYMLILIYRGGAYTEDEGGYVGDGYLGLLHFSSTPTPHVTFRKLDIGKLSPTLAYKIALDDSLGLVLVRDDSGRVTAFSYV
jgi:hypothetical protein